MKQTILALFILALGSMLCAQLTMPFSDIRHSSRDESGNVHLRWQDLSIGTVPTQSYSSINAGPWQEITNAEYAAGTREALVPYEFGQSLRYRLRMEMGYMDESVAYMHPAYLDADTFPPQTDRMAHIGTDATGDSVMVYAQNLDLTDSWFACGPTRFYSTLANVTGLFPTMNTLTSYNVYATTIVNPEALADSVAFAMIHTFSIPGVVSSGLYKLGMDSTGMPTFARIGDIQSQVSGGKLHLACNISDLANDPQFGAWPNYSNTLMVSSLTILVNIDLMTLEPEFGFADYSTPGALLFEDNVYQVFQNTLPQHTNGSFDPDTLLYSFDYVDLDEDFPLVMEIELPGGQILEPQATAYDYGQPVHYVTQFPYLPFQGTLRFSDNGLDFVTVDLTYVSYADETMPAAKLHCRMPNPLRGSGPFELRFSGLVRAPLRVGVFNLRGQNLGEIHSAPVTAPEFQLSWDGRVSGTRLAEGVYFLRMRQGSTVQNRKFIIIN
ncbi:MAG: T9SS C-terminal target domain-containing protein [Candidatus Syntrophosphaera sp.]|nr:T9SS C-terminal target domain-containing protein [Candidatus Syntrophosphaera sp.]